jgi:outer membrane receptor protein involved in Fe transport
VVVTATRTSLEAGAIPLHTTVLEADEIEAAPDSGVLDLLREMPSVNLARDTSSLVAQARDQAVSMRGILGSVQSRALPLLDGLPIVDPFGGWVTLSLAPKELVDRIEVVRGGGSSVWGNLALSGVVNMITRPATRDSWGATVKAAERSTADLSAFYSDLGRRWSGWIGGNHFETDGFQLRRPSDRGAVDEPKFRRWDTLHGRLAYSSSPDTTWTARAMRYEEHRGLGAPTDRHDDQETAASLTMDRVGSRGVTWRAQLFHRELDTAERSGLIALDRSSAAPDAEISAQPSRSSGASGVGSVVLGSHTLSVGADYVDNAVNQEQRVGWNGTRYTGRYVVSGRQRFGGVFVEDHFAPGARTSVQLGARFDRVWSGDASSVRSSLPDGEITGSDPVADQTERALTPRLGVVFAPTAASRWRGAVYSGFRVGTPTERFIGSTGSPRSVTAPSTGLEPERLLGAELGYDYTPSRRGALRLTVFRNEVDDLIQRVLVGRVGDEGGFLAPCGELRPRARCLQYRNTGEIRSTGLEVAADYRPTEAWRLSLDAAWMNSRVVENAADPALVGQRVERAPDLQLTAAIAHRGARFGDLRLSGRYASVAYDDAENTERLPAHVLVDLGYSLELGPRWQLFAGVENLFDDRSVNRWTSSGPEIQGPRLAHLGFRFRVSGGS